MQSRLCSMKFTSRYSAVFKPYCVPDGDQQQQRIFCCCCFFLKYMAYIKITLNDRDRARRSDNNDVATVDYGSKFCSEYERYLSLLPLLILFPVFIRNAIITSSKYCTNQDLISCPGKRCFNFY